MGRVFLLAVLPGLLAGQTFDAASVKPNVSGSNRQSQRTEGRTYRATNVPARALIRQAYGLMFEEFRLVDAPDWTNFERFDVVATLPDGAPTSHAPPMLRAMLADRFKLVTRREVREAPSYALVLARKDGRLGPQLKRAAGECGTDHPCELQIGGEIRARGQAMGTLAKTLLQFAGRSIVDRTGLTGNFDFDIQASEIAGDEKLPSIFTAIQEQLGLKLESIKAPVEFVVVERIERPEPN